MLTYLKSVDYQMVFCLSNKKIQGFNFLKKSVQSN